MRTLSYGVIFLLLLNAAFTLANTEKLIFRADPSITSDCSERVKEWATPETTLLPPYSTVKRQSLSHGKEEHWYAVRGLEDGMAYEIRISYPATYPTDFELSWIDACKVLPPSVSNSSDKALQDTNEITRLLSVKGGYTGVSHKDTISPVIYDIVLENLYGGFLFYQVYKVVIAIASVLCFGYFFMIPVAKDIIYSVLQNQQETFKQE